MRLTKWLLLTLVVAGVAATFRKELPAMQRYLRISRM